MKFLYTLTHIDKPTLFWFNRWITTQLTSIRFMDRYAPAVAGLSRSATPFGIN
ncbi:hypothetical protein [Spirosoma gilvum]